MGTKVFAIFILIMWFIAYVTGVLFNNPSTFLYWIIAIAIISITIGIYHTFTTLKKLEKLEKGSEAER
jgi:ABC-type multidrug transport system permease subunit